MKTTTIIRAGSIILSVAILALFLVPDGFANKNNDADSTASTSCDDKDNALPVFAYTRLKTSAKGTFSGFEIYLSNTYADCSMMIYSTNNSGYATDFDDRQNGDDMVIAWR